MTRSSFGNILVAALLSLGWLSGSLASPGNAPAFADALRRLAADPDLRARLGAASRDLLEAEYTWEKRARSVLKGIGTENV